MKKKIIIACAIVLVVVIAVSVYFIVQMSNLKKYRNADTYKLNGEEIISIKTAIGDRKLTKFTASKEVLELYFEDSNKEKSVEDYIEYLMDNGNYIKANLEDSNKKQISRSAENSTNIVIVETEYTDEGFKLTIQVGPGQIKVDPIE